jgi:predicted nucleic acid-binding protein
VNDFTPTPFILDTSVLSAIARADPDIIGLVQGHDARHQPLVIPALALTGASLDARNEEGDELLAGLDLLESVTIAPLNGVRQATQLAAITALTGLDPWDAHVVAVADAAICPVLTLDAGKWRQPSAALEHRLHIIEISDPGDSDT